MIKQLLVLLTLLDSTSGGIAQSLIQNVYGRNIQSLNGRWHYIIDPYETGYYDYRRMPCDQLASGKGGFYDDRQ